MAPASSTTTVYAAYAAALGLLAVVLAAKYSNQASRQAARQTDPYGGVRKYLLDGEDRIDTEEQRESLRKSKKPILWIHVPYERNARHWLDFGARATRELNQPYLYLTVKSIIQHCDRSFRIAIVDDGSFARLLPGWKIAMHTLADPTRGYVRRLGMARLLHTYGGMTVPISFLCLRDLAPLYQRYTGYSGASGPEVFVAENRAEGLSATDHRVYPCLDWMGAGQKEAPQLARLAQLLEHVVSSDYTAELLFSNELNEWCNAAVRRQQMQLVPAKELGVQTEDGVVVSADMLLGDAYVPFQKHLFGIWIPAATILSRPAYEWFARMSPEQLLESPMIVCKYLVSALAPGTLEEGLREAEDAEQRGGQRKKEGKDWIGFWRVPISSTLPVFGPKPMNIGNRVPQFGRGM